jgi:hypothetical protein
MTINNFSRRTYSSNRLNLTNAVFVSGWTIIPSVLYVNEGSSVTFNITTNNPDGTYYYTNSGTTSGTDFSDGLNSGSFTISGGVGSITKTLLNDLTTEGVETIVIQLRTVSTSGTIVATSVAVSVVDTSLAYTYSIALSPSYTSINEGDTVTFIFTTTAPNGTYYYTNSGTTSGADFSDSLNSGSFTITSGTGTVTKTLLNDVTTEGSETIIIQMRTGSTSGPIVATAATVTVADTSAITYGPTPTLSGTPATGIVSSASAISASFTTSASNLIVIAIIGIEGPGAQSVTSVTTGGLTWTKYTSGTFVGYSSYNTTTEIWWTKVTTAGSYTAAVASSSFDDATITIFNVAGCNLTNPFDTNASLPAKTSFAVSASAKSLSGISTTSPNILLMQCWYTNSPNTINTLDTGYTQLAYVTNGGASLWMYNFTEYKGISGASQSNITITNTSATTGTAPQGTLGVICFALTG